MEPKTKNFHKSRLQNLISIFYNACTSSICQKHSQALREWVSSVRGAKSEKIYLHFYPRSEKWKCLAFTLFREVESESFCFHSFSKSEKLNENDLRSRKEVSREYSRNLKKRDLFWFFWLPTLAQNMVWININFMSPPHPKKPREFSRNEILTGDWAFWIFVKLK